MARTDAQRAADAALSDAIASAARAYGLLPDGALLVDFVVVLEGARYDDDPDSFEEHHALVFRDGGGRTSVAVGLLRIGEGLLRHGERAE